MQSSLLRSLGLWIAVLLPRAAFASGTTWPAPRSTPSTSVISPTQFPFTIDASPSPSQSFTVEVNFTDGDLGCYPNVEIGGRLVWQALDPAAEGRVRFLAASEDAFTVGVRGECDSFYASVVVDNAGCASVANFLGAARCEDVISPSRQISGFRLFANESSALQFDGHSFGSREDASSSSVTPLDVCTLARYGDAPSKIPVYPTDASFYENEGPLTSNWCDTSCAGAALASGRSAEDADAEGEDAAGCAAASLSPSFEWAAEFAFGDACGGGNFVEDADGAGAGGGVFDVARGTSELHCFFDFSAETQLLDLTLATRAALAGTTSPPLSPIYVVLATAAPLLLVLCVVAYHLRRYRTAYKHSLIEQQALVPPAARAPRGAADEAAYGDWSQVGRNANARESDLEFGDSSGGGAGGMSVLVLSAAGAQVALPEIDRESLDLHQNDAFDESDSLGLNHSPELKESSKDSSSSHSRASSACGVHRKMLSSTSRSEDVDAHEVVAHSSTRMHTDDLRSRYLKLSEADHSRERVLTFKPLADVAVDFDVDHKHDLDESDSSQPGSPRTSHTLAKSPLAIASNGDADAETPKGGAAQCSCASFGADGVYGFAIPSDASSSSDSSADFGWHHDCSSKWASHDRDDASAWSRCRLPHRRVIEEHALGAGKGYRDRPPEACAECGKLIKGRSNLLTHMREQHGRQKRFACATCGKEFQRKYNLQQHQRTHVARKKWACDICDESFAQKSNFKRHMLTNHTKPLKCPHCAARFGSQEEAAAHFKVKHPAEVFTTIRVRRLPNRSFRCTCRMRFLLFDELVEHQKECPQQKQEQQSGGRSGGTSSGGAATKAPSNASSSGGSGGGKPRRQTRMNAKSSASESAVVAATSDRAGSANRPESHADRRAAASLNNIHGNGMPPSSSSPDRKQGSRVAVLSPAGLSPHNDTLENNAPAPIPVDSFAATSRSPHAHAPSRRSASPPLSVTSLSSHSRSPSGDELMPTMFSSHSRSPSGDEMMPTMFSSHSRSPSGDEAVPALFSAHSRLPSGDEAMPVLLSSHSRSPSGDNTMGEAGHTSHSRSRSAESPMPEAGHTSHSRSPSNENSTANVAHSSRSHPRSDRCSSDIGGVQQASALQPGFPYEYSQGVTSETRILHSPQKAMPNSAAPFFNHSRSPSGGDSSDGDVRALSSLPRRIEFPLSLQPRAERSYSNQQTSFHDLAGRDLNHSHAASRRLASAHFYGDQTLAHVSNPLNHIPSNPGMSTQVPDTRHVNASSSSQLAHPSSFSAVAHPSSLSFGAQSAFTSDADESQNQISYADRQLLDSLRDLLKLPSQSSVAPSSSPLLPDLRGRLRQTVLPLLEMYRTHDPSADDATASSQLQMRPPHSSVGTTPCFQPQPVPAANDSNPFDFSSESISASHRNSIAHVESDFSHPLDSSAVSVAHSSRPNTRSGVSSHRSRQVPLHPRSSSGALGETTIGALPPLIGGNTNPLLQPNAIAAEAVSSATDAASIALSARVDTGASSSFLESGLPQHSLEDGESSLAVNAQVDSFPAVADSSLPEPFLVARQSFDALDEATTPSAKGATREGPMPLRERSPSFSYSRRSNLSQLSDAHVGGDPTDSPFLFAGVSIGGDFGGDDDDDPLDMYGGSVPPLPSPTSFATSKMVF